MTSLTKSARMLQVVNKLGQAVRAQLIDSLYADLLQAVRFLRVYPIYKSEGVVILHAV